MFSAIYQFDIIPEKEKEFVSLWAALTAFIRVYEGGLGSRLHKSEEGIYIAYAQWPNKQTWEQSGSNLPPEAVEVRNKMRLCYHSVKTIHQLEVIKDLLT